MRKALSDVKIELNTTWEDLLQDRKSLKTAITLK